MKVFGDNDPAGTLRKWFLDGIHDTGCRQVKQNRPKKVRSRNATVLGGRLGRSIGQNALKGSACSNRERRRAVPSRSGEERR